MRTATLLVAAVAVVLFAAGWAGWAIHAATHPTRDVRVDRVFTGIVGTIDASHTAGCVKPDSGGQQVCSVFYSEQPVHSGEKVNAAHEWVHTPTGNGYDLLLIYPNNPQP